jgi:hypothetical protein
VGESLSTDDATTRLGLDVPMEVTDDQVRSLHESGWTRLPALLTQEAIDALRKELQGLAFQTGPAQDHANYLPGRQPAAASQHGPAWKNQFVRTIGSSPRLGGVAVKLMNVPEVLFVHDITFFKAPGANPEFGSGPTVFHQDLPFLPFDRTGGITIWIALVDMTEDMGALQYVDRSHMEGPLGRSLDLDIRETYPYLYDRPVAGGGSLRAGDAQAHWDLTLHGAPANISNRTREAYAVRYVRTDTIYTGTGHAHFDHYHPAVGKRLAESEHFIRIGSSGATI